MDEQTQPTRRRTRAEVAHLRERIYQMLAVESSLTARHLFERLVEQGAISNTERDYVAIRDLLTRMGRGLS
jgi:hypothetical protein